MQKDFCQLVGGCVHTNQQPRPNRTRRHLHKIHITKQPHPKTFKSCYLPIYAKMASKHLDSSIEPSITLRTIFLTPTRTRLVPRKTGTSERPPTKAERIFGDIIIAIISIIAAVYVTHTLLKLRRIRNDNKLQERERLRRAREEVERIERERNAMSRIQTGPRSVNEVPAVSSVQVGNEDIEVEMEIPKGCKLKG